MRQKNVTVSFLGQQFTISPNQYIEATQQARKAYNQLSDAVFASIQAEVAEAKSIAQRADDARKSIQQKIRRVGEAASVTPITTRPAKVKG